MSGPVKKVASRFLLPLEFYLGLMAIAWALSGGLGRGLLREVLLENHDSVIWWLVMLGVVGSSQCIAAFVEWFYGRRWTLSQLLHSAKARLFVSGLSALVWLWIVKMMIDTHVWETVFVLIIIAPSTFAMQGWIFWENFRVRLAVDESIPTSTMIFKR